MENYVYVYNNTEKIHTRMCQENEGTNFCLEVNALYRHEYWSEGK